MPIWSDTFAVGETVVAVVDGERGEIIRTTSRFIEVTFGDCTVLFPLGTEAIRGLWPWEK